MNPAEQRQVKGQMNKIANQFSSIEQVTGQYLGQGRKHPVTGSGEVSFQEILARKQSEQEPEAPERMSGRQAANILEDLQMYCEEMLAVEPGLADTWAERADALTVAIETLRK